MLCLFVKWICILFVSITARPSAVFLTRWIYPATVPHVDWKQKFSFKLCAGCKGLCNVCPGLLCVKAYICTVLGLLFLSVRIVACTHVGLRTGRRSETTWSEIWMYWTLNDTGFFSCYFFLSGPSSLFPLFYFVFMYPFLLRLTSVPFITIFKTSPLVFLSFSLRYIPTSLSFVSLLSLCFTCFKTAAIKN